MVWHANTFLKLLMISLPPPPAAPDRLGSKLPANLGAGQLSTPRYTRSAPPVCLGPSALHPGGGPVFRFPCRFNRLVCSISLLRPGKSLVRPVCSSCNTSLKALSLAQLMTSSTVSPRPASMELGIRFMFLQRGGFWLTAASAVPHTQLRKVPLAIQVLTAN